MIDNIHQLPGIVRLVRELGSRRLVIADLVEYSAMRGQRVAHEPAPARQAWREAKSLAASEGVPARGHAESPCAANRDEFHARPTAPIAPWADEPRILGGRDLQAGGTWIGLDRSRRFGLVTNYRELATPRHTAPSRGRLVPRFLAATLTAQDYLRALEADAQGYAGFNLLLGDGEQLMYASNRAERFARPLEPGLHGLSNHLHREVVAASCSLLVHGFFRCSASSCATAALVVAVGGVGGVDHRDLLSVIRRPR